MRRKVVVTPVGRFPSTVSAARHHKVSKVTVLRLIREACPGWRYAEPYQIPAGFVPAAHRSGRRKREERP